MLKICFVQIIKYWCVVSSIEYAWYYGYILCLKMRLSDQSGIQVNTDVYILYNILTVPLVNQKFSQSKSCKTTSVKFGRCWSPQFACMPIHIFHVPQMAFSAIWVIIMWVEVDLLSPFTTKIPNKLNTQQKFTFEPPCVFWACEIVEWHVVLQFNKNMFFHLCQNKAPYKPTYII